MKFFSGLGTSLRNGPVLQWMTANLRETMMLTIELIENDIGMRALFSEWLTSDGYTVHARSDVSESVPRHADLVVVNLHDLPGEGAETLRRVGRIYPAASVIGTSTQISRPFSARSPRVRELGLGYLVPKPCSHQQLLEAVVSLIGVAH